MRRPRTIVIGLDCVPPELAFDRYAAVMPNLSALVRGGVSCAMRSVVPPITVPAWACMTTGKTPGELGMYGFRDRLKDAYGYRIASSDRVTAQTIFDRARTFGMKTASIFVPPQYPPRDRQGTVELGCFLTPTSESPWARPTEWKSKLESRHGAYRMDVAGFRSSELSRIEAELFAMTSQHFAIAKDVWVEHAPDLMWFVEIGPDRLHHAFWGPMSAGDTIGERYYAHLDRELGRLLEAVDDDTTAIVVSDHGARSMDGAFAINEWLIREGWLVVKQPEVARPLKMEDVDWARTRAWGEGGYVGRIFFNVRGREPPGIVAREEAAHLTKQIAAALETVVLESGQHLCNRVFIPAEIYPRVEGQAPELIVAFGDLSHRAIGTIGSGRVLHANNDLGHDACNHDWNGIFAMRPGLDVRAGAATSLLEVHELIARSLRLS